ncbi:Nn.00g105160.m01.CDS01 [Neocucurbitaria sp. VM-36]
MADHSSNADDDITTRREWHYNNQRSSYRSSLNSNKSSAPPPTRSQTHTSLHRLEDFDLDLEKAQTPTSPDRADSDTLPYDIDCASPAPSVPYTKRRSDRSDNSGRRYRKESFGKRISRSTPSSKAGDERGFDDLIVPEAWRELYELNANSPTLPQPLQTPRTREQSRRTHRDHADSPHSRGSRAQRSRRPSFPLGRGASGNRSGSQLNITALPSIEDMRQVDSADEYAHSNGNPQAKTASRYVTELYTVSYLIFFAIWGTLARVGLQALTFYPGAPVIFSELWANVAGTFIMGFLAEDRRLFRAEWGNRGDCLPEPSDRPASSDQHSHLERQSAKARHAKVKKTIPMYIGLATGFCGSFTSFSSFIRDTFLALSNDLRSPINHPYPPNTPLPPVSTTVPRNGGYSFMAICATIFITLTACYSALKAGAHLALLLDPVTPTLPFRLTRRILDPLAVLLAWGIWLAAILLSLFPPHNAWRGQALFACVFAPLGCLARYYVSLYLNPIMPSFPLGTFAVNIFGTAVLGMAFDLQHVQLSDTERVGGSVVGCQVLQGIMDGFCGALTTVSTWVLETDALKRRDAYVYGAGSVLGGVSLLVVIMGSVRWTIGWAEIICVT